MSAFRRSLTAVAVASLTLAGLGVSASAEKPGKSTYHGDHSRPPAVARGLIVKATTATSSPSLLKAANVAMHSHATVTVGKRLTGKTSTLRFDALVPAAVAVAAAKALIKRSDVVWAAPDTIRRTATTSPVTPNDFYFAKQRNLWDTTYSSGGYSIKAPSLWRKTIGSPAAVVAVVDTGIRAEHPDLVGQVVTGYDMIGADQDSASTTYNTSGDGDGRDADPADPGDWTSTGQCGTYQDGTPVEAEPSSWHGTLTAGIIAAKTDNTIGIAGAAPGVTVQPVRVLGHCGGWDSDILAGITWASGGHVEGVPDNSTPAKVVNLSLGSTAWDTSERDLACAAYAAASEAGRARGSVFIAAAGNDGADANLSVPASCPGYVSVGATSMRGFSAWYSNYGTSVDLSAPGGDGLVEGVADELLSLTNTGRTGPVGSYYRRTEGTSMAAPQVSAGAALLYSLGLTTADDVERALLASVGPFHQVHHVRCQSGHPRRRYVLFRPQLRGPRVVRCGHLGPRQGAGSVEWREHHRNAGHRGALEGLGWNLGRLTHRIRLRVVAGRSPDSRRQHVEIRPDEGRRGSEAIGQGLTRCRGFQGSLDSLGRDHRGS